MPGKRNVTVVHKEPVYGGMRKTKQGKKVRTGTRVTNTDGEVTTLLTPAGKGAKYATELLNEQCCTNDGKVKRDKNGKPLRLSDTQRAFRSGYLQAQHDSAKAYNAKINGGKKK